MVEFPWKIKKSNTSVKEAACPRAHFYPPCLQLFKVPFFASRATQSQTRDLWACVKVLTPTVIPVWQPASAPSLPHPRSRNGALSLS